MIGPALRGPDQIYAAAPARRLEPRCLREFVIVDSGL
jgi:hypothetical protein